MQPEERGLVTQLERVAINHHNSDELHAHVLVHGHREGGKEFWIDRQHIRQGMDHSAPQIAGAGLGELADQRSKLAADEELIADRCAALDDFIERHVDGDPRLQLKAPRTAAGRGQHTASSGATPSSGRYYLKNLATTEATGYAVPTVGGQVAALPAGTLIGPTTLFSVDGGNAQATPPDYANNLAGAPGGGNFATDDSTQYFGVEFTPTGSATPDYGYVGVQLDPIGGLNSPTLTITSFAYDNSGAAIAAGDTGTSAPEPSSLVLLALGAVGLLGRRSCRVRT